MKQIIILFMIPLVISCYSVSEKEKKVETKDSVKLTDISANRDTTITEINLKIDSLKKELTDDFYITHYLSFIIASNLSKEKTNSIIENTIASAYESFYNNYFEKQPDEITTIFLFSDDKSYRYWAKKLFDDTDLSIYGYYKPYSKIMLMNISTGTGTLVHEMTHALVRFDFIDIPSWFNEGLGSLYERCSIKNGIILGYVNWRLPTLQKSIVNNSYTQLSELIKTDDDVFYGDRSNFNYSQARYLCLYLQERGKLKEFYKMFRDGYESDKTGKKYLEQVLGKTINEIDDDFKDWARKLKYEE